MYWVYIIRNLQGRLYIGCTSDLHERLAEHNSGTSRRAHFKGPWHVIWQQRCATLSDACQLEAALKRHGPGRGRDFYTITGLPLPGS